jgi:diguanylate cyclase (GGDEF)-like protein
VKGWRLDKKYKRYWEEITGYQQYTQESFSKHNATAFYVFGLIFLLIDRLLWQEYQTSTLFCLLIGVLSTLNYVLHKKVLIRHEEWVIPAGNIYILLLGKCLMSLNLMGDGAVTWTLLLCSLISTSVMIIIPYHYIPIISLVLVSDMIEQMIVNSGVINHLYHLMDDLVIGVFCIGINLIYSRMKYKELEHKESLYSEVRRDPLTKLYNRKYLETYFNKHVDESETSAILMLDLDNFKMANDVFGHQKGDEVLCRVAEILKDNFRESDCVARLGGDEFVVFLPYVSHREVVLNRVEDVLRSFPIVIQGETTVEVSVSIGVVFKEIGKMSSYAQLCECADEAMYKAKKSGKARAIIAA